MTVFVKTLIEAAAAFGYMLTMFGVMAICERRDRLKRRARFRALRRKHIQAQYEDACQSKLARQIWALEDMTAQREREYAEAKTKQRITINGIGAVKLSEVLTACRQPEENIFGGTK